MIDVTVVGAGSMARGIGARTLAGANPLTIVHPDVSKAEALAAELRATAGEDANVTASSLDEPLRTDVVVLAVPYEAVAGIVEHYRDELRGRVLVDISNAVDWETLELLATSSSAAEETARLVPDGTHVVKAFNTTFGRTLLDGTVAGHPVDVFIAGDDDHAKHKVAELVTAGGLRPIDVGSLRRARELEAIQLVHIRLQASLGTGYGSTLKILS